jgi:hypothetical protein
LSADFAIAAVPATAAGAYPQAVDEVRIECGEDSQNAAKDFVVAYDPAGQVDDIFAGLGENVLVTENGVDLSLAADGAESGAAVIILLS